jgi:hypothetical protein
VASLLAVQLSTTTPLPAVAVSPVGPAGAFSIAMTRPPSRMYSLEGCGVWPAAGSAEPITSPITNGAKNRKSLRQGDWLRFDLPVSEATNRRHGTMIFLRCIGSGVNIERPRPLASDGKKLLYALLPDK